jgi:multiple sugar transport system ATP-binding protein
MRPEHFTAVNGADSPLAASFTLPLLSTEKTGSDATVFLSAGEQLLAARIEPSQVGKLKTGQPVTLGFPRDKLNVFDARTGQRM